MPVIYYENYDTQALLNDLILTIHYIGEDNDLSKHDTAMLAQLAAVRYMEEYLDQDPQ